MSFRSNKGGKLKLEIFLLSSRCVSIRYFLFLYAVFILYKLIISRIMLSRFFKNLFPFFHKLNQLVFVLTPKS